MSWKDKLKLRASSADRWLNCPGSAVLEATNPWTRDNTGSVFAREGTVAHDVAEYCLRKALDLPVKGKPSGDEITAEMWLHGEGYAQYVKNITEAGISNMIHYTETSVKPVGAPHVSGTADYMGIDPEGRGYIIDYKYGAGVPVPVEGNAQLLTYATGVLAYADLLDIELETVTLAVYQPRVFGGIKEHTYSIEEVRDFLEGVQDADSKTYLADRHPEEVGFKATEKGCRWCPVKDYCSVALDLGRVKEIMEKITTIENFETLSMEELEEVYQLSKEAKGIFEKAEKAMRSRLSRGEKGTSFKAVSGVQRVDSAAFSAWLEERVMLGDLEEDQAFVKKPVTQTELKKVLDKDLIKEINQLPKSEGAPRIVDIDARGASIADKAPENFFTNI